MSDNDGIDRFSRERLAGYDPVVLAAGCVLVVGAGALAQNLLVNLALSGVGELRIVDFDEFEPHNAPRSPLFPSAAEREAWGSEKATVVARKLHPRMLAPEPVVRFAGMPIQALGSGAFDGVDVVVSCVDNPEARAYLSDSCRWLGLPLIEGGFDGPGITISCFPPLRSEEAQTAPCYRCANPSLVGTFSCQRHAEAAEAAGVSPAIQAAAAALGGLQAEAAIQALHGEYPLAHNRLILNVRSGDQQRYGLAPNPDCHGIHRRIDLEPVQLDQSGAAPVAELIAAVECRVGAGASALLPGPLVVEAFCDGCQGMTSAATPDWRWRSQPLCADCGGDFPRSEVNGDGGRLPVILTELNGSNVDGLTIDSRRAGLPDLAVFEAVSADGEAVAALRMGGTVEGLYRTVST